MKEVQSGHARWQQIVRIERDARLAGTSRAFKQSDNQHAVCVRSWRTSREVSRTTAHHAKSSGTQPQPDPPAFSSECSGCASG